MGVQKAMSHRQPPCQDIEHVGEDGLQDIFSYTKLDVHNLVTYINQTPRFEWYIYCWLRLQESIPKRDVV